MTCGVDLDVIAIKGTHIGLWCYFDRRRGGSLPQKKISLGRHVIRRSSLTSLKLHVRGEIALSVPRLVTLIRCSYLVALISHSKLSFGERLGQMASPQQQQQQEEDSRPLPDLLALIAPQVKTF